MNLNTDSLYRPLKAIKADLLKVIDELDSLNSTAVSFGGAIGTKLPVNVNSLIDKVEAILSSGTPDSVDGILEFLDNIPMGEIREKSAEERAAAGAALSRTKPGAEQQVDLSVHQNAPSSQIAQVNESKKSAGQKLYEESDFTWDAILNNPDIPDDLDLGEATGGSGYLADIEDAYAVPENDFDDIDHEGQPINDYSMIDGADEDGQIPEESLSQSDWKTALATSDPISFGSLSNLAEGIRDTGGVGGKLTGKQTGKGINMSGFHIE